MLLCWGLAWVALSAPPTLIVVDSAPPQGSTTRMYETLVAYLNDVAVTPVLIASDDPASTLYEQVRRARHIIDAVNAAADEDTDENTDGEAASSVLGALWFDSREQLAVYFYDPVTEQTLTRTVGREEGSVEAQRVALALILRNTAKALLAGETLVTMEPVALEPTPKAHIGAAGLVSYFGKRGPTLLSGSVHGDIRLENFLAELALQGQWPTTLHGRGAAKGISVRESTYGVSVRAGLRLIDGAWPLWAGLGILGDRQLWKVSPKIQRIGPVHGRRDLVNVSPWLMGEHTLLGTWTLWVRLAANVPLNEDRLGFETSTKTIAITPPWRVRPELTFGVRVLVWD